MFFPAKKGPGFNPEEIIFSVTNSCNLHCPHCFVQKKNQKLSIEDAKKFILSCKNQGSDISKIGFTGGEPFLNLDFLLAITEFSVQQDLMFDQIMTNGDWWHNQTDLTATLQKLYDARYDGKIGLSWDTFHGQSLERIQTFIETVQKIFGEDSINIQIVQGGESLPPAAVREADASRSSASPSNGANPRNAPETIPEYLNLFHPEINYYILPQTFLSSDSRAWNGKHWFKDDYCEGPGQILFVHPDGNIAPCCGFANEDPELFIGNITQDFKTITEQAKNNKMIKICYETGLAVYRKQILKQLKKDGIKGKCTDICTFCDYVCKLK